MLTLARWLVGTALLPGPYGRPRRRLSHPEEIDQGSQAILLARVVSAVLHEPAPHIGKVSELKVYEPTGPRTVTMARLHRENRYDRASDDVERVTGVPARTIETFVAARRENSAAGASASTPSRPGRR